MLPSIVDMAAEHDAAVKELASRPTVIRREVADEDSWELRAKMELHRVADAFHSVCVIMVPMDVDELAGELRDDAHWVHI